MLLYTSRPGARAIEKRSHSVSTTRRIHQNRTAATHRCAARATNTSPSTLHTHLRLRLTVTHKHVVDDIPVMDADLREVPRDAGQGSSVLAGSGRGRAGVATVLARRPLLAPQMRMNHTSAVMSSVPNAHEPLVRCAARSVPRAKNPV